MFGNKKRDETEEEKFKAVFQAPENPTKEDLGRAMSSLSVFLATMQVDPPTKALTLTWFGTVVNYMMHIPGVGDEFKQSMQREEWR